MVFVEGFVVILYNFELEYEEDEESSDLSESEYLDGSDEEVFGWLVILDWCKCLYCMVVILNYFWECLCCKEIVEVLILMDVNSELIMCIIYYDNFRVVCLNWVVLKIIFVCIKYLV